MRFISREKLAGLLEGQGKGRTVIAPRLAGEVPLYGKIKRAEDIVWEFGRPLLSAKEFLFPRTERLFFVAADGERISMQETLPEEEVVVFGVRPCDSRGIKALDEVFLEAPVDPYYRRRRENTTLIGVTCAEMGPTCFCRSVGGDPDDLSGVDVGLTAVPDGYAIRTTTDKGEALLAGLVFTEFDGELARPGLNDPVPLPDDMVWAPRFADGRWEQIAERCLSCRLCAYVCPTCRCFDIRDEAVTASNGGSRWERLRCWDGCTGEAYRKIAGGHNPRQDPGQRLRNRFYCKFHYFPARYGQVACTGCGRCIDVCPVGIDVTEVLAQLAVG